MRSSLALVIVLLTASAGALRSGAPTPRFPKGLAPMQLGRALHDAAEWDVARCAGCHEKEATAWALSGHAHARSGWLFEAALQREDPAWCVRCHAPQAQRLDAAPVARDAAAEERGVTCAGCHASGAPPLRSAELCAGCHQFGFAVRDAAGNLLRLAQEPQQDTFGEWQRWIAATGDTRTCVDCHMVRGDHAMGGVHRTQRLATALDVALSGRTLSLTLRDVGHHFPTGDVMRWVSVEASADPLFEEPVILAAYRRTLGVHVRAPETLRYLGLLRDTTLVPGRPMSVTIPARDASGRTLVAWRVVYHLVSERQERDGMIPDGLSRIILHAGSVP